MNLRPIFLLTALTLPSACDNDPVGEAPRAETAQAVQVAEVESDQAAKTFLISEGNSSLGFVGAKITDKHEGFFKKFSGEVKVVDGDLLKSTVAVTIQMEALETDAPKLTKHLKSPDFFDVAKFPTAKFQSTQVERGGTAYKITGNLTFHGVTKSISFPASIELHGERLSVAAEFGLNRKDFGVVYPGRANDLIKDEVLIKMDLKPVAQ